MNHYYVATIRAHRLAGFPSKITRHLSVDAQGPALLTIRPTAEEWCRGNPHNFAGFGPWSVLSIHAFPSQAQRRFFLEQMSDFAPNIV